MEEIQEYRAILQVLIHLSDLSASLVGFEISNLVVSWPADHLVPLVS